MYVIEVLTIAFVILAQTVGMVPAVLLVALMAVLTVFLTVKLTSWLAYDFFGLGVCPSARLRKEMSTPVRQSHSKRANQLNAMEDQELQLYTEHHPSDVVALKAWCERLEEKKNWQEYAHCTERLLFLKTGLDVSRIATGCHRLADLYMGPLNRPAEAKRVLLELQKRYPKSMEGHMAAQRAQRIG